jgi:hypothetical protein
VVAVSDYSEHGAVPVDDAAVDHPPTVDEVLVQQRALHPEQAMTSSMQQPTHTGEAAAIEAGGHVVDDGPGGGLEIEGPNSA